ncbi:MAG TPA: TIGR04551 family protein [Polyangia bacterium]|nr:TIGR04551 family protein [Polyangia bacterium]
MRRWSLLLVSAAMLCIAAPARAQFGPGGGGMRPPGGPGGGATQPGEEKEEGPAEAAPEEKGENPALQPLPQWPQQKEKSLQFFQLNGYIRFRAYLFHNLNMGYYEGVSGPKSPFFIPISEVGGNGQANGAGNPASACSSRNKVNCRDDNSTSADMRLRLEPTINVTEQVRVKAQIDVFDNMVLGSTPEGYTINGSGRSDGVLLNAFARTQVAPVAGYNSVLGSINAKRAWAEVKTPFGLLQFGRMPSHWGMGMLVNNGDCLDCDFGANADRVMFSTQLWGHFFAFLWDWVATGPTTGIIGAPQSQGQAYNADTIDDVSQWILALGKKDKPEELKDKIDQGKLVFNYGGYFVYRQQTWDESSNPPHPTNNTTGTTGLQGQNGQTGLVPRNAKAFIPDIWLRLNWKKLHIEAEGAMIVGTIGNLADLQGGTVKGATSILSGGFTLKADYKLLHDALKIYMEVGYASGDDSEDTNAALNYRQQTLIPVNNSISRFNFDPDYHVDLILFRRILGTVNNATYFKPGVSYDIVDNFGARLDMIYSLANKPVGYPGNAYNLGLELDAALMYHNEEEGFYASLVYGVLFPFGALNFPREIFGDQFAHNMDTAQTFQARLAVKF